MLKKMKIKNVCIEKSVYGDLSAIFFLWLFLFVLVLVNSFIAFAVHKSTGK